MNGSCIVQDRKTTYDHIGFTASGVENCRGKDKFPFIDIGVRAPSALFQGEFQFFSGL